MARRKADRRRRFDDAATLGLRPPQRGEVGGLQNRAALDRALDRDDVDRFDRGAGEPRRLAVQERARRQVERDVEAVGSWIVVERQHLQFAGRLGLDLKSAQRTIEGEPDMVWLAEVELPRQRFGDAV